MVAFFAMCVSPAGAVTLVKDGKPQASIVISEAAFAAEPAKPFRNARYPDEAKVKLAALDLQSYVKRMSGAALPIVSDAQNVAGPVVLVGASKRTAAVAGLAIPSGLTSERAEEGYVIRAQGDVLILAGNDVGPYHGTYYAVTEFLRRQGVRWIMPGEFGDVVPSGVATMQIADMSFEDRPAFRLRTWWCNQPKELGELEALWKLRNKMAHGEEQYIAVPGDSSLRNFVPDAKLAESRPELFARNFKGAIDIHMPNLSHPEAAQIAAEKMLAAADARAKAGYPGESMGIAPDDGIPVDFTPETWAMNQGFVDFLGREGVPPERSVTEEWITFVNRMTEHVVKVKPNFIVTTNGYANRACPPEGVKLHPNLAIMYAGIWADTTKPLNSPRSWHGEAQAGQIRRWTELCPRVFLYEYNLTMLVTMLTPVPQVHKTAENYKLYKQWGLFGFFNEARLPYFEEGVVTRYVRAQMMWQPEQDLKALVDDYYQKWYGPAAVAGAAFWNAIEESLLNSPLLGHEDRILPLIYSDELLGVLDRHVAAAEKAAQAEPYVTRVRIDRLTLEHLRAYMAYKAAEFGARWDDAVKALDRTIALRIELNKISPFLVLPPTREGVERYYAGETYWGALDRKTYFEKLRDMTNGTSGELIALAPKVARFTLDEASIGKDVRWYAPSHDRTGWRDIDMTRPFYTQVPGAYSETGVPYAGKMWYVLEVDVPASAAGKPARLYSPFLNCEGWTWVNGQYAGHREYLEAYISPAPLDLDVTDLIKPGQKNTIAVWVSTGTARSQSPEGFFGRVFLYTSKPPAPPVGE